MPYEILMQEAKGLTDDALMEVVHFMQFLKISRVQPVTVSISPLVSEDKKVYRMPGLYKGKIHMAEGFDDPLEEFEEYM